MIEKVKRKIEGLKSQKIKFRYNGSRNQIYEFEGEITKCYNFIFLIETDSISRTYSYADVLIGLLEVNI